MQPGTEFRGYQIVEISGRGGMATVYKAYQPALKRFVAIKVLPDVLAEDADFRERFQREAMAIAQLRHPNILTIFDYGEEGGVLFLVTEFVDGGTLSARLGQPLPLHDVRQTLAPVASALDYAHAHGIIHRDVKPSNILITGDGTPVLADFGIAYMAGSLPLTRTGTFAGTPAYMAPESAAGRSAGAAADQYALAIVAYQMLAGQVPFSADTPLAVLVAQMEKPPPPPRTANPSLPETTETTLLKGLSKSPDARFATVSDFVAALEPEPALPSAPRAGSGVPRWLVGVAAAVLVLVVATAGAFIATRTGAGPVAASTVPPSPAPTGQVIATDALVDAAGGVFPSKGSGSATDPLSFKWDFAYSVNGLVAHVVADDPSGMNGQWLLASTPPAQGLSLPRNFAVEVSAHVTRGLAATAYGLGVQAGPNAQYGFDVTPGDKGYRLVDAGNTSLEAGHSESIQPASQPNTLRMEISGNTIRLLVNGHELARTTRPELAGRQSSSTALRWALTSAPASGNSMEVRFNQFTAYALR